MTPWWYSTGSVRWYLRRGEISVTADGPIAGRILPENRKIPVNAFLGLYRLVPLYIPLNDIPKGPEIWYSCGFTPSLNNPDQEPQKDIDT